MKRILLTGGTGFIGRNILAELKKNYEVFAPGRHELDIKDTIAVEHIMKSGKFDSVILAGIPTDEQRKDSLEPDVLQSCMLSFMNFYQVQNYTERIIYFGSGAEFDKQQDVSYATEDSLMERLPKEPYGLAKFVMNQMAAFSHNIYNLRLFGCFGPTDAEKKFITHCIRCGMENRPISIRQDCLFNYLYVENLFPVLTYCIENRPKYHDYNVCSKRNLLLSEIAQIVKCEMKSPSDIVILNPLPGNKYSASNQRLLQEIPDYEKIELEEGIRRQIKSVLKTYGNGEPVI